MHCCLLVLTLSLPKCTAYTRQGHVLLAGHLCGLATLMCKFCYNLTASKCSQKLPPTLSLLCHVQRGSGRGARCYLAVSGGLATPVYLGSRSTFPSGKLGGVQVRGLSSCAGEIQQLHEHSVFTEHAQMFWDMPVGARALRTECMSPQLHACMEANCGVLAVVMGIGCQSAGCLVEECKQ